MYKRVDRCKFNRLFMRARCTFIILRLYNIVIKFLYNISVFGFFQCHYLNLE